MFIDHAIARPSGGGKQLKKDACKAVDPSELAQPGWPKPASNKERRIVGVVTWPPHCYWIGGEDGSVIPLFFSLRADEEPLHMTFDIVAKKGWSSDLNRVAGIRTLIRRLSDAVAGIKVVLDGGDVPMAQVIHKYFALGSRPKKGLTVQEREHDRVIEALSTVRFCVYPVDPILTGATH